LVYDCQDAVGEVDLVEEVAQGEEEDQGGIGSPVDQ